MTIDLILASLEEYLASKGFSTSANSNPEEVKEAKGRVAKSLHQFVEYRINNALDVRRKSVSAERIKIADTMSHSLKDMTASVRALTALNSAPQPMKNVKEESVETWMNNYKEWYNSERNKGMNIG